MQPRWGSLAPLIGSVEGIANTPAYRGLALAVFEDLELAEFGNRIPFLTFEVEADEVAPTVGALLEDASQGTIECGAGQRLAGFAAYGRSIRAAVEPLVDGFGIDVFDDGELLRGASGVAVAIAAEELGNSADGKAASRIAREQLPARRLPAVLRLTHYDPARDYQTGEARALAGEQAGAEVQQDLPAALDAGEARALAEQMVARAWARRDRLTLRLPPARLAVSPGCEVELPLSPSRWILTKTTIDSFVMVAELQPSTGRPVEVAADSGRIVASPDSVAGPLSLALFDVPTFDVRGGDEPRILLAASAAGGSWKRRAVEIGFGGQAIGTETSRAKSVLGRVEGVLGSGATDLIDEINGIEIVLIDADQWLTSCDDEALQAGENLAAVGRELIQFGRVVPLGGGAFRLSRLLRGRGGTEWACAGHGLNEMFCLLQPGSMQAVALPAWSVGATVTAASGSASATCNFEGEGVRPPAPINLRAALQPGGGLAVSWTRRSRFGFAWVDGIDAPLGEGVERYRVTITGADGTLELITDQPEITVTPTDLAVAGTGTAVIEVRQVGDHAVSRAAALGITLS
jgi:hypothetical protein